MSFNFSSFRNRCDTCSRFLNATFARSILMTSSFRLFVSPNLKKLRQSRKLTCTTVAPVETQGRVSIQEIIQELFAKTECKSAGSIVKNNLARLVYIDFLRTNALTGNRERLVSEEECGYRVLPTQIPRLSSSLSDNKPVDYSSASIPPLERLSVRFGLLHFIEAP